MNNNLTLLKKKKVLFVEDDDVILSEINEVLTILFHKVYLCRNGKDALAIYELEAIDLIISDIKMPIMNGLTLVEKIREIDYETPIILLTNFRENEYLIQAANLSVDGYILKPLNFTLLLKTIKKCIRRNLIEPNILFLGKNLYFNSETQELYLKNKIVSLGNKELELLKLLINNRSRTVTKDEIINKLWPLDEVSESSIKNLILRIRKKININLIISVRGVGYRLDNLLGSDK